MYSLHGLLALMRPVFDAVCQRLIVVSNCIPGSAHSHAASEISRMHPDDTLLPARRTPFRRGHAA